MITYKLPKHGRATAIKVLLEGKIVGTIYREALGWRYVPKGQKNGGEFV